MSTGIYNRTEEHNKQSIKNLKLGMLGKKHSRESILIMSIAKKGKKFSEQHRKNIGLGHRGIKFSKEICDKISKSLMGKNNPQWIEDRSMVLNNDRGDSTEYKEWRLNVYKIDNYKCKIGNGDCVGRLEAHHILPWRNFVELRYNINNGITLCQFHHPHGDKKEKLLSPYF